MRYMPTAPGRLPRMVRFMSGGHHAGQALAEFQEDIAAEAVADDDVGHALEYVPSLHVAHEVQGTGLEELIGLLHGFAAFFLLLPDVEETHLGLFDASDMVHEDGTHDPKLHQMLGLTIHVGSDVQHEADPALIGHEGANGRTEHAFDGV